MTWIPAKVESSVSINATVEKVYAFIEDQPASLPLWPGLESLEARGDGVYHMVFSERSTAGMKFKPDYVLKYICNGKDTVNWIPVSGNTRSTGTCHVEKSGSSVTVHLKVDNESDAAIPGLMKPVAKPFAQNETAKAVEAFLSGLKKKMEG